MGNNYNSGGTISSLVIKVLCGILGCVFLGLLIYLIVTQVEKYQHANDPQLHQLRSVFREYFHHNKQKNKSWNNHLSDLNDPDKFQIIHNIINKNLFRGEKSYTINKNKVYLCLKDEKGQYYGINLLIYVLAHELAHVICDEIGHTPKFHDIFDQILIEMQNEKLYDGTEEVDPSYCEMGDYSF